MENLYGMFRTRANIHRKACQHKTIKAVERMYASYTTACMLQIELRHAVLPIILIMNACMLIHTIYRFIEAMDHIQDLQVIWVPR